MIVWSVVTSLSTVLQKSQDTDKYMTNHKCRKTCVLIHKLGLPSVCQPVYTLFLFYTKTIQILFLSRKQEWLTDQAAFKKDYFLSEVTKF